MYMLYVHVQYCVYVHVQYCVHVHCTCTELNYLVFAISTLTVTKIPERNEIPTNG